MPHTSAFALVLAQTQPAAGSQPAIGAAPAGANPAAASPTAAPRTEVIGAPGAATTTAIQQPNGAQPIGQQQSSGGMGQLIIFLPIIALFGFMMWTSSRNQKKERQRREEMINAISTNDTVQTIGGIIGRVAEIKDDEIILRVDESTNTKMRFTKAAVQQVVHKSGGGNAVSQAEAKPMKQTAKV